MFHRSSQSKLPCCFLDSQHPLFWYLAEGQWSSLAAKSYPKWEHYHRKLWLKVTGKNRRSNELLLHVHRYKVGHAKMKASTFQRRQFWFCHSWQSLWNYLTGPPTSPACKEVTQHIPEQDKRGVEGHRDNWQTYFLIRNGPEPSTTSQSSLFDSLETSPSL